MALPSAPANLAITPGPVPNSIYVKADEEVATPAVETYNVYVDSLTGVGTGQFKAKKVINGGSGIAPNTVIELPEYPTYFVTMTAVNSEGEGAAATEVSLVTEK